MSAPGGVRITVRAGDLTAVAVDAIVNPANRRGAMGGGVAKAIRTKGGQEIEREARAQAPIEIGTAVLTPAGSLPCRYVLHAPTMIRAAERSSAERVRQATLAALRLADQHELQRIAFPGMGTGVGRVPKADAAHAMIETIRAFSSRHMREVILVDRDQEIVNAWQRALGKRQARRQRMRAVAKETTERSR